MSRTYRLKRCDPRDRDYMVIDSSRSDPGKTVQDEFYFRQYCGIRPYWRINGARTLDEYNKAAKAICRKDGSFTHGGNGGPHYYRNLFNRNFRQRDRRSIQKYLIGLSDDVMLFRNVFPGYWW